MVFGPGLGLEALHPDPQQPREHPQLWDHLQGFKGLLLLDADGLNRLAELTRAPGAGASAWLRQRQGPTWLTPHGAEFQRLFPELAGRPPLEATAAAAKACGATVLLKGAHSVIATADGRRWQLVETCAAAARAGLGDVLAGYAAGRGAMAIAATRAAAEQPAVAKPVEQTALETKTLETKTLEATAGAMSGGKEVNGAGTTASGCSLDGALLAAVALNHALAGEQAWCERGPGGATPMAVAAALAKQSFN